MLTFHSVVSQGLLDGGGAAEEETLLAIDTVLSTCLCSQVLQSKLLKMPRKQQQLPKKRLKLLPKMPLLKLKKR